MTYVRFIEDQRGDVLDIEHYCSPTCFYIGTGQEAGGSRWPCPERADYDQHCPICKAVSVPAIEHEIGA